MKTDVFQNQEIRFTTSHRKNIRNEIKLEIELFTTLDKKSKKKAFGKITDLDMLSFHYFSQEYEAVKSSYMIVMLYVNYNKRRYLTGFMSLHVSSMNKILRNVFFGSEFFGKFRNFVLSKYKIPLKFLTISRFVMFPQFRGIGLAREFVDLLTNKLENFEDVFMIEIYSSMLYNFDFMPKNWVKYSNVVRNQFSSFDEYIKFCRSSKLVKGLDETKKILHRALKRVDDGGRVRAADMPCNQIQGHAVRMLRSSGDTELIDKLESKKKLTCQSKTFWSFSNNRNERRTNRTQQYLQKKSGSMFNRMEESDSFVNIASYMFYIPENKCKDCEFFKLKSEVVSYESLLFSYTEFCDLFQTRMSSYVKHRTKQLPILIEMFKEFCDLENYKDFSSKLHKQVSQASYLSSLADKS